MDRTIDASGGVRLITPQARDHRFKSFPRNQFELRRALFHVPSQGGGMVLSSTVGTGAGKVLAEVGPGGPFVCSHGETMPGSGLG